MEYKHIHCIGIGGIGISALARYYHAQGYRVTGTNLGHSPLLTTLAQEGIEVVGNGAMMIDRDTTKVIYTEAIIDDDALGLSGVREEHQAEIKMAQFYEIPLLSYPEALAEVFHTFPIKIAVAGAHGKSTTSAMIGTLLHDNASPATTITGTLVKAFGGKNVCIEGQDIMVIEACEYRNAFLNYRPDIAIITNIDPDHLDFFKTEEAYYAAFERFMAQSRCVVMLGEEYECFQNKIQNNEACPLDKGGQGGLEKYNHIPYTPELTEYAREQRNTSSLAENRMWYDVLRLGELKQYRFLRQKPLLNFIADFYCSELGLIIEVDGDNHESQKKYDQYRTEELSKYGLTVLRFHNLRVMEDPVGVEKEIIEWIQGNPPGSPFIKGAGNTQLPGEKTLVLVHNDTFEVIGADFGALVAGTYTYSLPDLLVPGGHIRLDASLAYVTSQLLGIDTAIARTSLQNYPGSWRRMEMIKTTAHNNLFMSDYGHHPTEIIATLGALREASPERKIIVFFEPHQYSRTYDLREEFATSFSDADMVYIPDIYAARDIDERRDMITADGLAQMIARNTPCEYVGTLDDAGKKLQEVDAQETNALILLLGAGTIDELRSEV